MFCYMIKKKPGPSWLKIYFSLDGQCWGGSIGANTLPVPCP